LIGVKYEDDWIGGSVESTVGQAIITRGANGNILTLPEQLVKKPDKFLPNNE
jgi:hypothetical protein